MPPPSFRLALEPTSFNKAPATMKYAVAGIGLSAFDLARVKRRIRWTWMEFISTLTLTPVSQGPFPTYKSDTSKLLGLDVNIYVAFIRRRLVLFAAEGKTPDGVYPFEEFIEDEPEPAVRVSDIEQDEIENKVVHVADTEKQEIEILPLVVAKS